MRNFSKEYIKFLEDHPDNPANKSKIGKSVAYRLGRRCFFCLDVMEGFGSDVSKKTNTRARLTHYNNCCKDFDKKDNFHAMYVV